MAMVRALDIPEETVIPSGMVAPSRTRYAKSGSVHIAYQTMGTGPIDLIYVEGFLTHLDVMWELPDSQSHIMASSHFSAGD